MASANLVFPITGMVLEVKKSGTEENPKYFHKIKAKPKGEYSEQTVVNISSDRMIGSEGQEVSTEAKVNGYIKSFSYEKEGEKRKGENQVAWFTEVNK